jgi:hypothetical protein
MQRTVVEVNAMRYNSVSSSSREEVDLVETESGPKSVPPLNLETPSTRKTATLLSVPMPLPLQILSAFPNHQR